MKKFMFSAVALVAFSFAGMANEVKEKKGEVKSTETKKVEKIETTVKVNCLAIAIDTYNSAVENGANETQAVKLMASVLLTCSGF